MPLSMAAALQAYAIRQLGDPGSGAAYIPWLPLGGGGTALALDASTPAPAAMPTSLGSDVSLVGSGASTPHATTIMRPFSITVVHSK